MSPIDYKVKPMEDFNSTAELAPVNVEYAVTQAVNAALAARMTVAEFKELCASIWTNTQYTINVETWK